MRFWCFVATGTVHSDFGRASALPRCRPTTSSLRLSTTPASDASPSFEAIMWILVIDPNAAALTVGEAAEMLDGTGAQIGRRP